jgi:hypothetical protein
LNLERVKPQPPPLALSVSPPPPSLAPLASLWSLLLSLLCFSRHYFVITSHLHLHLSALVALPSIRPTCLEFLHFFTLEPPTSYNRALGRGGRCRLPLSLFSTPALGKIKGGPRNFYSSCWLLVVCYEYGAGHRDKCLTAPERDVQIFDRLYLNSVTI